MGANDLSFQMRSGRDSPRCFRRSARARAAPLGIIGPYSAPSSGFSARVRPGATCWRDLPEHFGPWSTAYSRFRRWAAAGVWQRVLEELQREADARGQLDWNTHYVDGTVVRAHQHAAGAVGGQDR